MKTIWPLLCVALIALPVGAQARTLPLDGAAIVKAAFQQHGRHRGDNDQNDGGNPGFGRGNGDNRDNGNRGGFNGGGYERRDDRINRAIAIASGRGRVLDAGAQGGSIFWVRVATERGRVDLLVDVDSGRIIGER